MYRPLQYIGLAVYVTILVTSFLHVLHSFLKYNTEDLVLGSITIAGWIAGLGVAIGLDLAIIYFSFVAVITGSAAAKTGSVHAMVLVWFAVTYSMVSKYIDPAFAGDSRAIWDLLVGLALSFFVPLTSLRVGQVLGELSSGKVSESKPTLWTTLWALVTERIQRSLVAKLALVNEAVPGVDDDYLGTDEVAKATGIPKSTLVKDWREGSISDIRLKRLSDKQWLWNLGDVIAHYGIEPQIQDDTQYSRTNPAATKSS